MGTFLNGRVTVKVGDITLEEADAVVNAANSSLFGGGGVDAAIHERGGPAILEACRIVRNEKYPAGLPTGEAVVTTAGAMAANFIIHTVGPVYGENRGRDEELLRACYLNCLNLAREMSLVSIAFPAISTGVYRYPKADAARVASGAIKDFLTKPGTVNDIRLVFFSEQNAAGFLAYHAF